ncbi:type IV pilus biogenesis/stability protein PilW [Gammaproteobacteria bacterium 42_54_T18]|nr:type IV pilus biogenesis/stability protein PilW [Gammaproteobacteria bacterium 42_54_T18]
MIKRSISVVLIALLMGGCVIETSTSSLERNRNIDKAVEAYIAAGMVYLKEGDLGTANRKFKKAYGLNPDNPEANNALALFYTVENEGEQVEKYYKAAIAEKPGYSIARNNYGSFLFDQGRFADARDQLLVVVKDYDYAQRNKSLESLGYCYLNLGDSANAERYFMRALQRNARMGRSLLELAEINFNDGRYKRAERYLESFDRLSAPNPRHLWLAVRLQRILKDKHKLASFALALKNIFPDTPEYKAYVASLPKSEAAGEITNAELTEAKSTEVIQNSPQLQKL